MSDTNPPSYKQFIELEDWYLLNREDADTEQLESNLQERQVALWHCLQEIKDNPGRYFVPQRLISTMAYAMEDLITRGEADSYFKPFPRPKHKPKYHPIIRMAIEHAVKYVLHHEQDRPDFNRPNYWNDIVLTYEVSEKTVRTWTKDVKYRNAACNNIPWDSLETGMKALELWGEIYRNNGKASSQQAVRKKAPKRKGK